MIPARWLKPKEAMMTLPVVGQMNTVFVVAIVFGMFLILTRYDSAYYRGSPES